jgi:dihydropteroate synthase
MYLALRKDAHDWRPVVFKKKCNVEKYGMEPLRFVVYIRDDINKSMYEISVSIKEMFSAGVREEMNSLMDICIGFVFSVLQNMELIQRVNLPLLPKQAKVLLIMP